MREPDELFQASRTLLALVTPKARPTGLNISLDQLFTTAVSLPFDPMTYKTRPCPNAHCQDSQCVFYHCTQDRRRNVNEYHYQCKACRSVYVDNCWGNPSACRFADKCTFAHSFYELKYHPHIYKTRECTEKDCMRGDLCWNKHEPALAKEPVAAKEEEQSVKTVIGRYSDKVLECKGLKTNLAEAKTKLERAEGQLGMLRAKLGCCLCKRGTIAAALSPCGDVFCQTCLPASLPRCPFCLLPSKQKLDLHLSPA